jgi:hypothetical protein
MADFVVYLVFVGAPVLLTLACGAALSVESRELKAREEASIQACNQEASAAAASRLGAQRLPDIAASSALEGRSYGTRGLDPQYQASDSARAAYGGCMNNRAI